MEDQLKTTLPCGFRPLTGIMVLINHDSIRHLQSRKICFRPLAGILVLISQKKSQDTTWPILVSVPLRGLWFLSQSSSPDGYERATEAFPSPCGDYGSYHNALNPFVFCVIAEVSVPLRGLWFLSMLLLLSNQICNLAVSVPLRGLWFLSIYSKLTNIQARLKGFRPLAGIMVLILLAIILLIVGIVSVPLRGLWFLSFLS